jgi:hypothetical protein
MILPFVSLLRGFRYAFSHAPLRKRLQNSFFMVLAGSVVIFVLLRVYLVPTQLRLLTTLIPYFKSWNWSIYLLGWWFTVSEAYLLTMLLWGFISKDMDKTLYQEVLKEQGVFNILESRQKSSQPPPSANQLEQKLVSVGARYAIIGGPKSTSNLYSYSSSSATIAKALSSVLPHAMAKPVHKIVMRVVDHITSWMLMLVTLPLNLVPFVGSLVFFMINGLIVTRDMQKPYWILTGRSTLVHQAAHFASHPTAYVSFAITTMLVQMIPIIGTALYLPNVIGNALLVSELEKKSMSKSGNSIPTSAPTSTASTSTPATKKGGSARASNLSVPTQLTSPLSPIHSPPPNGPLASSAAGSTDRS